MKKLREEELELSKRLTVSMNKNLKLNSYKSVEGIKYNLISNLELIKIVKDFIQEAPKHETVEKYIANYKVRLGNCLNSLRKEAMIDGEHQKVVTVKEISDTLQKLDYIVANHHGKPDSV